MYVLLHARTAALVPVVTTAVREGDATATQSYSIGYVFCFDLTPQIDTHLRHLRISKVFRL